MSFPRLNISFPRISRSLKILCRSLDLISRSLDFISSSLKMIMSRERDIKLRECLKNKICMSLHGFHRNASCILYRKEHDKILSYIIKYRGKEQT